MKWTIQVHWADRMLQTGFLHPDAMPIRLEQTLFLLMSAPLPFVSGLGVAVDAIVFLLVGTASVSSESEPSSELSVVALAAREC